MLVGLEIKNINQIELGLFYHINLTLQIDLQFKLLITLI